MIKKKGLNQFSIVGIVTVILIVSIIVIYLSQSLVEKNALPSSFPDEMPGSKLEYEIYKLAAEIRQIRSDTAGSLFWLKMFAIFVTVGGAVGGYLVGQSRTNRQRIDFENRKNIDVVYQSIVQELSAESPVLRSAAAVKLGAILESFPAEWNVTNDRRNELIQLTKKVLASSLAIEQE